MTAVGVPAAIAAQVSQACALIEQHPSCASLLAIHLYGSALDGGLRPLSDIDLLVTLDAAPTPAQRDALALALLSLSAAPGTHADYRALEVTVIVHADVMPWRHPARRVLQFGEWLRDDLRRGVFEPPVFDPDLAILLTQARQHSLALKGIDAGDLLAPVPASDFRQALAETVRQWREPADWAGDERNIVLALARAWYSAATGRIAPKDVAALWAAQRADPFHQPILQSARLSYLGLAADDWTAQALAAFIAYAKAQVLRILEGDTPAA